MAQNPTVSVIMPAYNAEQYIETAIRSMQNQTVTDWELLVVDDCSTDGTRERIRSLAEADARIKPIFSDANRGAAASRNTALDRCSGAYVALLDADDAWHPTKLERQLLHMQKTRADICYCSYAMIDAQGKPCHNDYIVPETTSLHAMLRTNVIGCSTVMFTREIAERYRFRTDFYHEDYVLWLQLLRDGKTAVGIQDVLSDYRILPNSRASGKLRNAINRWKIYRDYMGYSSIRSAMYILEYAYYGLIKYR